MTNSTETPAVLGPVQRQVRPAVAEALRLAHAYADAKLMRYGLLNIANPPDPRAAFEALATAIDAAAPGEREHLRAAQARAVMPLIGPLLDAWECCSQACREELPELDKQLRRINRAMEDAGEGPNVRGNLDTTA